jgi:hypothetical protein
VKKVKTLPSNAQNYKQQEQIDLEKKKWCVFPQYFLKEFKKFIKYL